MDPKGTSNTKCILEINNTLIESTSQIMFMISRQARRQGYTVYTASPKYRNEQVRHVLPPDDAQHHIFIGGELSSIICKLLNKYTGYNGIYSYFTTLAFLKKIDSCAPDIVHIHNLHDCNLNLGLLFQYFRKRNLPIVWTLHDCWAYTGNCIYYSLERCSKWESACHHCTQRRAYPYHVLDKTKQMHRLKKKWFLNQRIIFVTPSKWLKGEVNRSFLKVYDTFVINNGINLEVFRYRENEALLLRQKYLISRKFVVLGVASLWDKRKGLDIFNKLANDVELLDFQFVAIGITQSDEMNLSSNIIKIRPIRGQPEELAKWYSAADVFLNPTRDDNFPTTNLEALACGTGVITFDTGGSPEMLTSDCGIVVPTDDYDALKSALISCKSLPFVRAKCRKQAEYFKNISKYQEYIDLFNHVMGSFTK